MSLAAKSAYISELRYSKAGWLFGGGEGLGRCIGDRGDWLNSIFMLAHIVFFRIVERRNSRIKRDLVLNHLQVYITLPVLYGDDAANHVPISWFTSDPESSNIYFSRRGRKD